uniref:Transposase n=1 Tax=Globodera rostochiensis TaxID=31243 RepID=A0A914I9C5_GLORO
MPVESSIWQCGLFRSGSTSGVLKHLKNVHKNSEYELKFAEVEKQRGGEKGSMDKHIVIGSGGLSSFDKKVIHWIACTQASFSDINNPATNALFMDNNPLHKLHDESVYRTKILPIVYEMVKSRVQNELDECPKIAFTSDIWSDSSNAFISLTAHGIGKKFERKSFILSVSEFDGSHTGERIAEKLRELLKIWKIPASQMFYFVRDEGSNFKKAFSDPVLNAENFLDTNLRHIWKILLCVDHWTGMKTLKTFSPNLGVPIHQLLQDIPTRWNAAYNMLRRIAEQQEALAHYAILNRKFDFTFDVNESTLLHELTNLLEPMEQLSRLFCCQTSPISVKYPFAKLTVQNLSQMQFENADVIEIRDQIIGGLRMKFFGYSNDRNHQIAMFLDPRFKEKMADFPDLLRRLIRLSTPAVTAKKSRNADFFEPQSSQT